jgi:hypothetical protein
MNSLTAWTDISKHKTTGGIAMEEKTKDQSWMRTQVTLRLPAARLAQLRSIANRIGPDATPTDAICKAIAEASALLDQSAILDQLDYLEESLETMAAERRFDSDRLEAAVGAIGQNLAALQAIMEAASKEMDEF